MVKATAQPLALVALHGGTGRGAAAGAGAAKRSKRKAMEEDMAAVLSKSERAARLRSDNSQKRLDRFGEDFLPGAAALGSKSLLEKIKVSDPVRADYRRRMEELEAWRLSECLPAPITLSGLTALVLDKLDMMFMEGFPHGDG